MKDNLKMADMTLKSKTLRTATAEGCIIITPKTLIKLKNAPASPKGNILIPSKVAGILAAKQTYLLLPLCHPLSLVHCDIKFSFNKNGIKVKSCVKAYDRTGVEMEALSAVSVTLLNIYDMVKPLDKTLEITGIKLLKKTGGRSGDYVRQD